MDGDKVTTMFTSPCKIRLLSLCLVLSIMAHILFAYALRLFGTYEFNAPVNLPQGVVVDLAYPGATASAAAQTSERPADGVTDRVTGQASSMNGAIPALAAADRRLPTNSEPLQNEQESEELPVASKVMTPATQSVSPATADAGGASPRASGDQAAPPMRAGGTFLAAKYEKLTFQIMMFDIPVGTAELESKYENGETLITLRIRSNIVISSIYPVDDVVESRHVSGGFIMSKIRQQEGPFRSDELFTINPGKKRVTWFDNLSGRSLQTTVPTADVLDSLSALYYLRNRQLVVGRTETLHIYDSETYADVPVEIMAREEMRLANLTMVNTLVVRPLQKTAGIFRRTGDVLIWMTDDNNKVPVKIVTSIHLGKVTAELVSAESTPHDEVAGGLSRHETGPPALQDGRHELR